MKHIQNTDTWKDVGLFEEGDYLIYGFKKTQKIISAIYLVTSLIKDNEPLKWEIRDEAISLLSRMMHLNSAVEVHKTEIFQFFFSALFKIKSLLNIADKGGLVSPMNADIISREVDMLVDFLREHRAERMSSAGYILSDTFFSTDMKAPEVQHVKNTDMPSRSQTERSVPVKSSHTPQVPVKDKKDTRQTIIIDLLKKNSRLTIKDFVEVIRDCSEKTIQRELIELVEKGTIVREGERRWSTYSLKV